MNSGPHCEPEPAAWAEFHRRGRVRRFTGAAALAVTIGPIAAVAFALGVCVGVVIGVMSR